MQTFIPEAGSTTAKKPSDSPKTSTQKVPSEASVALLSESRTLQNNGDYPGAASVIERALRIEPGNASLWLELAQIRLAQKDFSQAQTLAQKALTLSQGNESIEQSAEQIIQQVKDNG